jgi:putative hydrolase of the HAD superfamily
MVRVDVAGWMTLNPQTLPALIRFMTHAGVRLALLSNAPEPLATAIDHSGWAPSFDRRFYSCRLGLAKPDSAVYKAVLDDLGATPQSVLFIDDRPENVLAAAPLGLQAVRFTSAEELPGQLDDWAALTGQPDFPSAAQR